MSLATVADLLARFSARELTELTAAPGATTPDTARLQTALDDTGAWIKLQWWAIRRTLLPPRDLALVAIHCDLARRRLYTHEPPPEVETRATQARADLDTLLGSQALFAGETVPAGQLGLDAPAAAFDAATLKRMPP